MTDSLSNDPQDLEAQDEVLQVMFWMRGEKLAEDVAAADVARFTGAAVDVARRVLDRLAQRGLVTVVRGDIEARYALSPEGLREGGRRFADEFADLMKPGHGECHDPDCDCRRSGSPEDCRHR
jgi:hypothetical protein